MKDDTRMNSGLKNSRTAASKSIKNTLAINESEERKDFLEITPTAMSEFICKKCGKTFQNHDDLIRHMSFEERKENGREISEKSRIDRQRTVPIDFKRN